MLPSCLLCLVPSFTGSSQSWKKGDTPVVVPLLFKNVCAYSFPVLTVGICKNVPEASSAGKMFACIWLLLFFMCSNLSNPSKWFERFWFLVFSELVTVCIREKFMFGSSLLQALYLEINKGHSLRRMLLT